MSAGTDRGPEPTRARYPDREGFVEHGDEVRVFYEVYGDAADTVCLLPLWAVMHSRVWRCQISYLARHFRVDRHRPPRQRTFGPTPAPGCVLARRARR